MLSSRIDREKKNARQTFSTTSRASAFGGERSERKQLERLREKLCSSFLKNLCFVFPGKSHSREIELVSERFSDLNSRSLSLSLESARARKNTRIERTNERTNENATMMKATTETKTTKPSSFTLDDLMLGRVHLSKGENDEEEEEEEHREIVFSYPLLFLSLIHI